MGKSRKAKRRMYFESDLNNKIQKELIDFHDINKSENTFEETTIIITA